jgi:plasmid stability protein
VLWLQLLVCNLDAGVKQALHRRARSQDRSMEEETRLVLVQATQGGDWASTADKAGLDSRLAALFAGKGLEEPIATRQGHEA